MFVGTVESINDAKLLIEYQIDKLRELDELRKEKIQMDEQLRSLMLSGSNSGGLNSGGGGGSGGSGLQGGYRQGGGSRGGSESRYNEEYHNNQMNMNRGYRVGPNHRYSNRMPRGGGNQRLRRGAGNGGSTGMRGHDQHGETLSETGGEDQNVDEIVGESDGDESGSAGNHQRHAQNYHRHREADSGAGANYNNNNENANGGGGYRDKYG